MAKCVAGCASSGARGASVGNLKTTKKKSKFKEKCVGWAGAAGRCGWVSGSVAGLEAGCATGSVQTQILAPWDRA